MKRAFQSFLLSLFIAVIVLTGLSSCNVTPSANEPEKLSAPVVTLEANLAKWDADPKAEKFEISIDGALTYLESSVTSKKLNDGESFKVRAVGDGTEYTTSDWSNLVTYVAEGDDDNQGGGNNQGGGDNQGGGSVAQPTKLGTPVVTVSSDGLASWTAVSGATGYKYKINDGAETSVGGTSVQLSDGQSISVKAVGDGTDYSDSDYSTPKTYTASGALGDIPSYLGILASKTQPSKEDGVPSVISRHPSFSLTSYDRYRSFGAALEEYYSSSENYIGATHPAESDYPIYAVAGETVYVEIWLNNPSQYTILSLKLNGVKYQIGGDLFSYFIDLGGVKYNCVYAAVTIPQDGFVEKSYTVTEIEYIAKTYINADGTDEFMNNNDTVTIGLPYNAQKPTISDFNPTSVTINSYSATLNVTDAGGLVGMSGGWLGIAVYDGYDIVANQALAVGSNNVGATGLVEDTTYWITVYLYADLHDGKGVIAHILLEQYIITSGAITVNEVKGTLLYNSEKDGYYGAIKVNTTLNSNTAEYIKLEILKDDEVVYTDTSYNGTATISEGILCGNSYTVRVYYKDNEYTQGKYVEENAWINYLGTPWYNDADVYTFVNDAVHYFRINNGDGDYPAIESFTYKLYSEDSARWYASDVLYILKNSTAIEDLKAQIDILRNEFNAAYGNHEQMNQIHSQMAALEEQLRPLEKALWYLENRADNNRDVAYWEAEVAKGKYFYVFEYNGVDNENIFKVGQTYYVILEDVLNCGYGYLEVEIDYKYDNGEGKGLTDGKVDDSINLDRELTNHWVEMENVSYADGKLTLTLFNERDYWTGIGAPYAIGYVYKVEVDGKVLYIDESKHEFNIDEEAWFNEYIQRIKAGQSFDGLMEKYVSDYESSYTIPVDVSKLKAGTYNFGVSIRLIGTDYEDGECQATRWADRVAVYVQIEKPTIEYKELYGQYYGVVTPESLDGWNNDHYEYEAIDENGNPVDITRASEAGYARFYVPSAGTKVRVRIPASGYWLASEWSDWVTFDGIKVAAPVFGEYDTTTCKISWTAGTENVSHYLYTINGGTPVRVELNGNLSLVLNNGDVLRVMCVASEQGVTNGYLDSEWSTYTCVDNRTALATPSDVKIENGMLSWSAVDGATYYIVECVLTDGRTIERQVAKLSTGAASNVVSFRVRAMTEDLENYRPSDYSESIINTSEKG